MTEEKKAPKKAKEKSPEEKAKEKARANARARLISLRDSSGKEIRLLADSILRLTD